MGPVRHRPLSSAARAHAPAPLLATALVALALGALAGCGGKSKSSSGSGSSSGSSKPTVSIAVAPWKTSNHGRPMHALVRLVTLKQFVEDQYASVAQLVVNPDESVLASFVVFPGIDQSVTIDKPAKGALAVYFLFTDASGTTWKQLYDSPPDKIRLELGEDEIIRPGTKKKATAGSGSGNHVGS